MKRQLPSLVSEAEQVFPFAHVLTSVCSSSRGHNLIGFWTLVVNLHTNKERSDLFPNHGATVWVHAAVICCRSSSGFKQLVFLRGRPNAPLWHERKQAETKPSLKRGCLLSLKFRRKTTFSTRKSFFFSFFKKELFRLSSKQNKSPVTS